MTYYRILTGIRSFFVACTFSPLTVGFFLKRSILWTNISPLGVGKCKNERRTYREMYSKWKAMNDYSSSNRNVKYQHKYESFFVRKIWISYLSFVVFCLFALHHWCLIFVDYRDLWFQGQLYTLQALWTMNHTIK